MIFAIFRRLLEACSYGFVLLTLNHFALNSQLGYGWYFDPHFFDLGSFLLDRLSPELHLLLKSEDPKPRVPGSSLHLLIDLVEVCGKVPEFRLVLVEEG